MDSQSDERRKRTCRNCEVERLEEQVRELWFVVTSPDTTGQMLEELSHRAPVLLLERIAEHHNALPGMLERLSYHPVTEVRVAVAENLNTPHHIIFALTHDSCPDIRYSIAENHNTPLEALDLLTEDENPYVSYRAQMTLTRLTPQPAQHLEFPRMVQEERKRNQTG